ncbi:MAG: CoA protein activase [Firmicutes bacterium]|nr:CoA protein activase [Bacillota bacterium]
MMKITYPHMGTLTLVAEQLIEGMGQESVTPHRPTRQTLALGARYAPEFACIPFKLCLGTYLEGLSRGADTIVSGGGYGPCRAGLYGEIHRRILNDLGYDPRIIFFWPPLKKPVDFIKKLSLLKGHHSWIGLAGIIRKAWAKLSALDEMELLAQDIRARELKKGETSRAFNRGAAYLDSARSLVEIKEAHEAALQELHKIDLDEEADPLKVGIVGEIYVQLEPFANLYVEETLGEMGVHVRRSIYLTSYTKHDVLSTRGDLRSKKLARSYLPQLIGGHGQNSVGDVIRYSRTGYDGVVQLAPFTCIPEIVAKSLMPYLSREYDIPVLTLFIDEQTGRTGAETRLEAFVDLMLQRREKARSEVKEPAELPLSCAAPSL